MPVHPIYENLLQSFALFKLSSGGLLLRYTLLLALEPQFPHKLASKSEI